MRFSSSYDASILSVHSDRFRLYSGEVHSLGGIHALLRVRHKGRRMLSLQVNEQCGPSTGDENQMEESTINSRAPQKHATIEGRRV